MLLSHHSRRKGHLAAGLFVALAVIPLHGKKTELASTVLEKEGTVEAAKPKANFTPAEVGQKLAFQDRVRTGELSRAAVELTDLSVLRLNELTTVEIRPPTHGTTGKAGLDLAKGSLYFFSREKPQTLDVKTPVAAAALRGTEFVLTVEDSGKTTLTLIEGDVLLSNEFGQVTLKNGEQGTVEAGQAPRKTAVIEAVNLIQWCLYYPGILDPASVRSSSGTASLAAYRQGSLLTALKLASAEKVSVNPEEAPYRAALLLSVGQVDKAEEVLRQAHANDPQSMALRQMIAAVKLRPLLPVPKPTTASEFLADSYYKQAFGDLQGARSSARETVRISPDFGFGWVRVAEMEFSFGEIGAARRAVERGLALSPLNAQAHSLLGFLASAQNETEEALTCFNRAIELDPALGNAWLGRGLCRIRQGDAEGGRKDLQLAAALEPNRSLLRSYLAKAFSNAGNLIKAKKELGLARLLDPLEPTPWLYQALLQQQQNRYNEAVGDLQKSIELNDNRRLYRSNLLLDQDRAVRSANLATIYQQAGLQDVSVNEATRAVNADYANFSSHLFLANSFDALRDPTRINLRYETAWFNELLVANLLAPVGAGTLSQNVSQQEYSRLFDGDHVGAISNTEVFSTGELRQRASQYGTAGNTSWSLDVDYDAAEGARPNNQFSRLEWYSQIKQQLTPQDSVFLLTKYQDQSSGDTFQYHSPASARLNFRTKEDQEPLLYAAYHRQWTPNVQSFLTSGRLISHQTLTDTGLPVSLVLKDGNGKVGAFGNLPKPYVYDLDYDSSFVTYASEFNTIWEEENQSLIVGARFQFGQFTASSLYDHQPGNLLKLGVPGNVQILSLPVINGQIEENFERLSGYAYYNVKPFSNLLLTGALTYDTIDYPSNFRHPPLTPGQESRTKLSPKVGLTWDAFPWATVRGTYGRAMGGVSFDESFRLEPTQVAGFNQAFRTIINESVIGSVEVPSYEIYGVALDLKPRPTTYVGIQFELLKSEVERDQGVLQLDSRPGLRVATIRDHEDYEEKNVTFYANQLLGPEWALGAQYRSQVATLTPTAPGLPPSVLKANSSQSAWIQQGTLFATWNHPSGWFARPEAVWTLQSNDQTPALQDDNFWQLNVYAGYRFWQQRGEVRVGLLNLTGDNYQINPINYFAELPRERTVTVRLKITY